MVQHFFHLCVYDMSLFQVLLFGEHGCPLERSKWLRHKERGTGNYLNLTENDLLLGNLCNTLPPLFQLREAIPSISSTVSVGSPSIKYSLTRFQPAFKRFGGAMENILPLSVLC